MNEDEYFISATNQHMYHGPANICLASMSYWNYRFLIGSGQQLVKYNFIVMLLLFHDSLTRQTLYEAG